MREVSDPIGWIRLLKLVGACAFAAGVVSATWPMDMPLRTRRYLAASLAGPGLALSWGMGFVLLAAVGYSVLSAWVILSIVTSLACLQVTIWVIVRDDRANVRAAIVAISLLILTIALMRFRP